MSIYEKFADEKNLLVINLYLPRNILRFFSKFFFAVHK